MGFIVMKELYHHIYRVICKDGSDYNLGEKMSRNNFIIGIEEMNEGYASIWIYFGEDVVIIPMTDVSRFFVNRFHCE